MSATEHSEREPYSNVDARVDEDVVVEPKAHGAVRAEEELPRPLTGNNSTTTTDQSGPGRPARQLWHAGAEPRTKTRQPTPLRQAALGAVRVPSKRAEKSDSDPAGGGEAAVKLSERSGTVVSVAASRCARTAFGCHAARSPGVGTAAAVAKSSAWHNSAISQDSSRVRFVKNLPSVRRRGQLLRTQGPQ